LSLAADFAEPVIGRRFSAASSQGRRTEAVDQVPPAPTRDRHRRAKTAHQDDLTTHFWELLIVCGHRPKKIRFARKKMLAGTRRISAS
jgi:hypothetical protein